MKLLSLDCSTSRCSLAFMERSDVVFELFWESAASINANGKARHESMIDQIEKARAETGWRWGDVEWFIAGRGPGNYSGLRAALLTVQALAAPAQASVCAVSSMEAMALDLMGTNGLEAIAVIGDARRQSFWFADFELNKIKKCPAAWETVPHESAAHKLTEQLVFATPHWAETEWLRQQKPGVRWIAESQYPSAPQIARLALLREGEVGIREPLVPLYAHPAV